MIPYTMKVYCTKPSLVVASSVKKKIPICWRTTTKVCPFSEKDKMI